MVSERVRVSKGMEVTQNMLYERGGKLISPEQIIYVGEQEKIWPVVYGETHQ